MLVVIFDQEQRCDYDLINIKSNVDCKKSPSQAWEKGICFNIFFVILLCPKSMRKLNKLAMRTNLIIINPIIINLIKINLVINLV